MKKDSKCKGPGAELYLGSSKNSEGGHVAAGCGVREEMRAERRAETKCISSYGSC